MSLGETLRLAREEKGQTISQVAEATRMMVQIVEDLEREDFRRIAAPIYGRGFIKLYAEHLGLDSEPLAREFMEIYTGSRVPQVVRRTSEAPAELATVEPSDRPSDRPTDCPTVEPSDSLTVRPSAEPDLFSVAAGRNEAVRAVPDPAQPDEAAAPPRARLAPVARPELRPPVPVDSVPRRASVKKPLMAVDAESAVPNGEGSRAEFPAQWIPTVIAVAVAVLLIVVVVVFVRRHHKTAATPLPAPSPSIKVERILPPAAPFFD